MTATAPAPQPVPLHGIEAALAQAWTQARQDAREPQLVSRTVTMHLVAVASLCDRDDVEQALARVTARHPCRLFVAYLSDDDGPGQLPLRAELTIQTEAAGKGVAIVQERVTLHGSRADSHKLPGLIRPLIDDDVPRHLFWHGSPASDSRDMASLAELVGQVILDSSTFDDPVVDLGRMQSLETEHHCRVRDLNWYRLRPWRRALATAMEHVPYSTQDPTKVVIHHPDDGRGLAAALTLSAWLRQRLRASTTMLTVDDGSSHREPVEVALAIGDAFVRVHRMEELRRLEVMVALEDQCHLPTRLPMSLGAPGDLLAAAVDEA